MKLKTNTKTKKILSAAVFLIIIFIIIAFTNKVVGEISGLEYEKITIDGTVYKMTNNHSFTSTDMGWFLGWVTTPGGEVRCLVFKVRGDREGKYLYRLWGYDGAFYVREE